MKEIVMKKEEVLKELKWREIINNITDEEKFMNLAKQNELHGIYIGFDPSFKSLHLGNYIMIRILKIFKKYGWKTIALVGGATGMIGDPSGKSTERNLLNDQIINDNIINIEKQLKSLSQVDIIFNNKEIWANMNVIQYLREIGKMFQINRMLEKDIIKNRLNTGISYSEFSYSILQSYDWSYLYKQKHATIQCGGSDQWGNITAGIDILRKTYGDKHNGVGLTINLLLNKDGKKFGKSESGAIYLDPNITSPYAMYHFLINQTDDDLKKLFNFFTDYNQLEIQIILKKHFQKPKERIGQKKLAKAIISDIHGHEIFEKCEEIAALLFQNEYSKIPQIILEEIFDEKNKISIDFTSDTIINSLDKTKIFKSKREIREFINLKAIHINGEIIINENAFYDKKKALHGQYLVLKKGKKKFFLIKI